MQTMAELIVSVKAGLIGKEELGRRLSLDAALTPREQKLIHILLHYIEDQDIRERDAEYQKWMNSELDKALQLVLADIKAS